MQCVAWPLRRRLASSCQLALPGASSAPAAVLSVAASPGDDKNLTAAWPSIDSSNSSGKSYVSADWGATWGASQAARVGLTAASAARPLCLMAGHSRPLPAAASRLPEPDPCPAPRQPHRGLPAAQAPGGTFASDPLCRCAPTTAGRLGSTWRRSPAEAPQTRRGGGSAAFATSAGRGTAGGEPVGSDDAKGPNGDLALLIQRLESPPPDTCALRPLCQGEYAARKRATYKFVVKSCALHIQ